jgi:hypothetical protein
MLTTHFHLGPRLRMSRAIPLLPLYAFMECIGTTVPFSEFVTFTLSFFIFCTIALVSQEGMLDSVPFLRRSYVLYFPLHISKGSAVISVVTPCRVGLTTSVKLKTRIMAKTLLFLPKLFFSIF